MFHGRTDERAVIDRLLADARRRRSGALVVRGEAGIGKSALLDHAAGAVAGDMRVLRGVGIEAESELPFAGLHLLLRGVADHIGALPARQARALRGALGTAPAAGGDRFLTGLAVLTLLADLAEERPLLCLVDDAHWLDHASAEALLFAARRLDAEGVALVLAARDLHAPAFPAPGLAEVRLPGLDAADAEGLLAGHAADLPRHVRDQILREARGNPLALLELAAAQREGRLPAYPYILGTPPTHGRIQQTFTDRIGTLPERTRTLLLVAAADDTGDPAVVLGAAARLGAAVEDLEPAEHRRLLLLAENGLVFRHPLIRAAAYRGATLSRRLAAHRALADVLGARGDDDRRAWHLAAAVTSPDERVAAALERTAEQARTRGGHAAIAAAYERAASLSPARRDRGRRLTVAARAAADAGQFERAATLADLADQADPHAADPATTAEVARVRAVVAAERGLPKAAHEILVGAALSTAGHDPDTAAVMLLDAVEITWFAGDLAALADVVERTGEAGIDPGDRVRALVRAARGLTGLAADEVGDGLPALRELIALTRAGPHGAEFRERARITWWHLMVGEHAAACDLAAALVRDCRVEGAIGVLPRALALLARAQALQGRHRDALASATEGRRVARDTGQSDHEGYHSVVLAWIAAVEGDREWCEDLTREVLARGTGANVVWAGCALGLLDLGLGRHEAVLSRLEDLTAGPNRLDVLSSLPDLVEAAARLGLPGRAAEPYRWYQGWADQMRRPWAGAIALRCRALLAGDEEEAGEYYARAVRLHRTGERPFDRARTELLHGEWLRRSRRRAEARPPLRSALEIFERLGARPWAGRARAELRASGESVAAGAPDRGPGPLGRLSPQELQVVRLAATGLSNRDIGARLFLSPRTVGHHLYNAYPKLGVASRGELARLDLSADPDRRSAL
ncbi:helix-turn-helix transcriptional regulator [Streptosporangium sp. DT93]|uniref:helix-turn-helix transcriptional regulator n=1 Tax=Streptosporangium sp. DT93 TaxID=3393428 RepID=UPI003CF4767D